MSLGHLVRADKRKPSKRIAITSRLHRNHSEGSHWPKTRQENNDHNVVKHLTLPKIKSNNHKTKNILNTFGGSWDNSFFENRLKKGFNYFFFCLFCMGYISEYLIVYEREFLIYRKIIAIKCRENAKYYHLVSSNEILD